MGDRYVIFEQIVLLILLGVDRNFEVGMCRGEPNTTFGCPILSATQDWALDICEVWETKPPDSLTYAQEKMIQKKSKTKSVLADEDNADKAISSMLGHNFSEEDKPPDVKS